MMSALICDGQQAQARRRDDDIEMKKINGAASMRVTHGIITTLKTDVVGQYVIWLRCR